MAKGFQLLYGSGVRAKSSELLNRCIECYASGKGDTFLYIVPTRRYSLEISRGVRLFILSNHLYTN